MHYLHTMIRVENLERALEFYCGKLGLVEVNRREDEKGRYTNVFLSAEGGSASGGKGNPLLELTYNWPASTGGDAEKYTGLPVRDRTQTGERNFGHLAYAVENIYDYCAELMKKGIVINRPPRDGRMAFIRSPEGISIELLQIGDALPPKEPWASMPSTGAW